MQGNTKKDFQGNLQLYILATPNKKFKKTFGDDDDPKLKSWCRHDYVTDRNR